MSKRSLKDVRPERAVVMIASGDARAAANRACWPAQRAFERELVTAIESLGGRVERLDQERLDRGEIEHGFIDSHAAGRAAFARIDPEAPLLIAEAVWQYSEHVLVGLARHRGPILIAANWSGQHPGLVGALNLRGTLTKAGVEHSLLWAESFSEPAARAGLARWLERGEIRHDRSHVRRFDADEIPRRLRRFGRERASELRRWPALMGCLDEGCMGMFNAIIPDHLLHPMGVHKERISQSTLWSAMRRVPAAEADAARAWCESRGMRFLTGPSEETDLTDAQVREQLQMYIAAARLADRHGLDAIGIQYQLGLVETCASSDVAEGLLNCSDRPPVLGADGREIRPGVPIPHFNEVDECSGLDAIITNRVWTGLGMPPDTTLHDVRWGDADRSGTTSEHVWVFEISGAVPPSHLAGGYAGAESVRQPTMYFLHGGGSIRGVSRSGAVVWSRVFVAKDRLHMDLGRASAIELPASETRRRWEATTPQWPIMHAVTHGVSRDQMMGRHQSNHVQVVYAAADDAADRALACKAAMADAMGIKVHLCGSDAQGRPLPERLERLRDRRDEPDAEGA